MTEVARALAGPIGCVGAGFMSDPALSATGVRLGYASNDLLRRPRWGAGRRRRRVAAAALVFFAPDLVATVWERSQSVQPRRAAAQAFL